jgi:hypothetical protein
MIPLTPAWPTAGRGARHQCRVRIDGTVLPGLGACTAITLKIYAIHKAWPLTDAQAVLHFNPEGPAALGLSEIPRQVTLHGVLTVEQCERLWHSTNARSTNKVLIGAIQIATALDQCAVAPGSPLPAYLYP